VRAWFGSRSSVDWVRRLDVAIVSTFDNFAGFSGKMLCSKPCVDITAGEFQSEEWP